MINTYNESSLHNTLKNMYCMNNGGMTEQHVGSWICDVVGSDGSVVEIQTGNISVLKKKCEYILSEGRKVTIVHPIVVTKYIETYECDGTLASKKKSPKSETVYSVLRGLTGIYPLLTKKNFALELIDVSITEQRRKTEEPVQLENKSRRFLKSWKPFDKKLNEITKTRRFSKKNDWKKLIPTSLPDPFTPPDLAQAIANLPELSGLNQRTRLSAAANARLLLWLYTRMGIIFEVGKKGRSRLYSKKPA